MIHDIDYIVWNFGKVKRVFGNAIYNEKNFAIQVMATFEMGNGITAYVEGGYVNPAGVGLTTQMRIYSGNSLLEMSSNNTPKLMQTTKPVKEINVSGNNGYFEEINYFVNCVKCDKNPEIISTDDAIKSLSVCLDLKKSLKEKRWIIVD